MSNHLIHAARCIAVVLTLALSNLPHWARGEPPSTKPFPGDAAQSTAPSTGPTSRPAVENWFPGMLHPPHLAPKLPPDFTLVSASKGEDWNMYDGVIWSPPRSAKRYEHAREKKYANLEDPLFYSHLSDNVGQVPGTDNFTVEKDLGAMVKATGLKNATTQKYHWGKYPVLAMTGDRPNGGAFFVAWVGINSPDGWTILIDYRIPSGDGHPTAYEREIWQRLMQETTEAK